MQGNLTIYLVQNTTYLRRLAACGDASRRRAGQIANQQPRQTQMIWQHWEAREFGVQMHCGRGLWIDVDELNMFGQGMLIVCWRAGSGMVVDGASFQGRGLLILRRN